jgi:hypothetical protein
MAAPSPPPGWYPDPSGAPVQRYFGGTRWSERRTPKSNKERLWIIVGIASLLAAGVVVMYAMDSDHSGAKRPTMDKSGIYYHIDDSAAGGYETSGSARANGRPCNWMRLSPDWSTDDSIEALAKAMLDRGDVAVGQTARVTVKANEYFVSFGCEPWRYIGK